MDFLQSGFNIGNQVKLHNMTRCHYRLVCPICTRGGGGGKQRLVGDRNVLLVIAQSSVAAVPQSSEAEWSGLRAAEPVEGSPL